jgi:hypothetical protein
MSKTPKVLHRQVQRPLRLLMLCLDFQEDNYNLGTAITYLLRAGKKPNNPISSRH